MASDGLTKYVTMMYKQKQIKFSLRKKSSNFMSNELIQTLILPLSLTLANLTATAQRINSQCSLKAVTAQSLETIRGVSADSQRMANPLQMRCEMISTNVEEKKTKKHLHDKKAGKIKEKKFIWKIN